MTIDIVIPTIGRASLETLLRSLERTLPRNFPGKVFICDGRRGPAAARNAGWRKSRAEWICFLDDDVEVSETWFTALQHDLQNLSSDYAASQGRITVPLPQTRATTDWERNVAGLENAQWITADMAVRHSTLKAVGGFDERFRRAFREDADLGLRFINAGYAIAQGSRTALHPVRHVDMWISVRLQAGNADDILMRMIHGKGWHERANAARGRFTLHLFSVACFMMWVLLTADFAYRRIAPGPKTVREIGTMLVTSAIIPFAAVIHSIKGVLSIPRWYKQRPLRVR